MKKAVVALGGNAISPLGEIDSIPKQFAQTRKSLNAVIALLKNQILPVITHGNGPQVGNAALRTELTADLLPYLPLGINVADTEGGMGYMIEQSLQNRLREEGLKRSVVTLVTQVLVDANDPSISNPTKFIGMAMEQKEAEAKAERFGWSIKQTPEGLWRRVVPSPEPLEIINASVIEELVDRGHIVIAAGGGGIPVYRDEQGNLEGLDAVIDKDRASALLGNQIAAEELYILTSVPHVSLDYATPNERPLKRLTVAEAKQYLEEGQFPPGNMGPKIEAAIHFLENGGKRVVITDFETISREFSPEAGTVITL